MERFSETESLSTPLGGGPAAVFGIGRLFDVVPDAVIVGEASSGRVVLWNPAAASMFDYAIDEGPGLLIEDLVPEQARLAHRNGLIRLASAQPTPLLDSQAPVELQACRRDGSQLWIELRLAHVAGPTSERFVLAVIRDISSRKLAEELAERRMSELRELQGELRMRNAELDRLSRSDALTGVWNRRHLDEHLAAAVAASHRHGRPLAVLLIDVDRFKEVNDQHGHAVGDAVLLDLVTRLGPILRRNEIFGRWGGEEFLVIAPDTTADAAVALAERLRQEVRRAPFSSDGVRMPLTISVGVSSDTGSDATSLLSAADSALRAAKASGRDRVKSA